MSDIIRIPNILNYTQEIINGDLILTPKIKIIQSEYELLNNYLFGNSTILECSIKNNENEEIISEKGSVISYASILKDIWVSMPTQLILQNTTFNFKLTNENGKKGYKWCSELLMSYQGKNADGSIFEIIKMCNLNNYSISIKIKLFANDIIYYNKKI